MDEFLYNLDKNNYHHDSIIDEGEINEYLNLYVNFKLKVYEARMEGLDTTESYKTEYKKYLDQLAESYMKDDSIVEVLVKEAYEHLKTEVKVSHILIRMENPANPRDTSAAYQKINQIYRMANNGGDFNQLAVQYSEDPSASINQGNLGFFTGLQMVYPFEKTAYSTPVGKVSSPFKTRFGYHILKVHEIRPSQGKVEVAHIMFGINKISNSSDSLKILNRVLAIHDSLTHGGGWDYFCEKYSEDINSKEKGGRLPPFENGRIFPAFSEAAFALQIPGELSGPVLTPYGWHIIKLIHKYPLASFEDMKEDLTSRIKQDSRSEIGNDLLIAKLKKENGFYMNHAVREKAMRMADSTLLSAQWHYDESASILDSVIFSISDKTFTVKDFFNYARVQQRPVRNMEPSYYFNQLLTDFTHGEILNHERNHLGDKYFDFRMISKEYADGILLFEIMDNKVWSFTIQDSAGLMRFYEENIDNYQWGPRLKAVIFRSSDVQVINSVRVMLQEPYYYVSDVSIPVFAGSDESHPHVKKSSIDSLLQLLTADDSWRIEVAVSDKNDDKELLSFLEQNGIDAGKILVKYSQDDVNSLRLISIAKKDLDKSINDNWGVNLHIESGTYNKGELDVIDLIEWKEGIHDLSIEDEEYIIYVEKVLPAMDQEFGEIQGKVISDYQNYLEKQWINELRDKYDVQINHQVLKKIVRDFEKP